jgi:hypothetical protein
MKIFMSFIFMCSAALAAPVVETRIGLFYEIGKKTDNYLFKQETKLTIADDLNRKTEATIVDPTGKLLMRETSTIKDGLIVDQVMEQLQINEKYTLQVNDGKVTFKTFDIKDPANPKLTEENTVKVPKNFFTGPSLEVFLKKNLDQIKAKKEQQVEFGIFELQKAMSFDVEQTKKIFADVPDLIPVKMELSSLLSVFVDPLLLEIDPQTAMMKRYRGRTPVRSMKNGKLVPFDGDIYYEIKK